MPGSSPDVGVTGYTLGGGLSWFGRRHGFACNRVEAIELVTADGEAKTVDADNDPDLFWALRGGGGGYALVTALHVNLLPLAEAYGGILIFPAELGADAVRAYRDWAAEAPEEITTVVRFITPPDIPDVPEPLRGKPLLTIDGAFIGSQEDGEAAIAPLRALGEPLMDGFTQMPTAGLSHIHMDPENPVPGICRRESVELYWACQWLGATYVPLSPRVSAADLALPPRGLGRGALPRGGRGSGGVARRGAPRRTRRPRRGRVADALHLGHDRAGPRASRARTVPIGRRRCRRSSSSSSRWGDRTLGAMPLYHTMGMHSLLARAPGRRLLRVPARVRRGSRARADRPRADQLALPRADALPRPGHRAARRRFDVSPSRRSPMPARR